MQIKVRFSFDIILCTASISTIYSVRYARIVNCQEMSGKAKMDQTMKNLSLIEKQYLQ